MCIWNWSFFLSLSSSSSCVFFAPSIHIFQSKDKSNICHLKIENICLEIYFNVSLLTDTHTHTWCLLGNMLNMYRDNMKWKYFWTILYFCSMICFPHKSSCCAHCLCFNVWGNFWIFFVVDFRKGGMSFHPFPRKFQFMFGYFLVYRIKKI